MIANTFSYGIIGLEARPVQIEVDVHGGLPMTQIVGLPDNVIKESKERIKAAIKNSGYRYPVRRVTINLSPAHLKKEGPAFELAMAIGILAADEQIPHTGLETTAFMGELSLDGQLKGIQGALATALRLKKDNFSRLILPEANAAEASLCPGIPMFPATTLVEAINHIQSMNQETSFKLPPPVNRHMTRNFDCDFSEVKGQQHAKRGLEIAAAGGHNVLMIGPPGCGKSMLAKRFTSIVPGMTMSEALETTKIHSIMNLLPPGETLLSQRPFRTAHHTTSSIALVGGGSQPRPGEITLSHNGILFLDELPEFSRAALEALRQPLEDHIVTIARAQQTIQFPCRFVLLAAMNPCPCGYLTHPNKQCHCQPNQIQKYINRISGPLLDRIDIHLDMAPVQPQTIIMKSAQEESSRSILKRTTRARSIQTDRYKKKDYATNAQLSEREMHKHCQLGNAAKDLVEQAINQLSLSARAANKILKLSRTIADLDESPDIQDQHVAEAIQYRSLDRNWQAPSL